MMPSPAVAAMPPELWLSEALVIWMYRTAMNAPSVVPRTAIHCLRFMDDFHGFCKLSLWRPAGGKAAGRFRTWRHVACLGRAMKLRPVPRRVFRRRRLG